MKCRIGLGKELNYEFFEEFIDEVLKSGINIIYVHARNAILSGISPSQNRSIPPLDYNFIKKIKIKYPKVLFVINGGIDSLEKANALLSDFDGVMLGRLIQNNPFILKKIDNIFFNSDIITSVDEEMVFNYFNYIKSKVDKESVFRLLSPLLQIFFGIPNSKVIKTKINNFMINKDLNLIEDIILNFVKKNKVQLN